MAVSRQKISAVLRAGGLRPSRYSKGRVSWRCSEGYDLRMGDYGSTAAEVRYNVRIGFEWTDENEAQEAAGLAAIEQALNGAGISTLRVEKKVFVLDPR